MTGEICPTHDASIMDKMLKRVREQQPDATPDDAKDYYVMSILDKRIDSFHATGKFKKAKSVGYV